MGKQIDWRRARAPKQTEDQIGEGFTRKDGTVTPTIRKDWLAKRAMAAEIEWMRKSGLVEQKGRIFKAPKKRRK